MVNEDNCAYANVDDDDGGDDLDPPVKKAGSDPSTRATLRGMGFPELVHALRRHPEQEVRERAADLGRLPALAPLHAVGSPAATDLIFR